MQDKIIAEAESWIGTPFHHGQQVKNIGVDCLNLIIGIGVNCKLMEPVPDNFLIYPRIPSPKKLIDGLNRFAKPTEEKFLIGSFCAISWSRDLPMHVALYIGNNCFIHATQNAKRVEKLYMHNEMIKKIHSWWKYKGI